jgi:hypothetical protein
VAAAGGGRGGRQPTGGDNAGAAQLIFLVLGLLAIVLAPIAAQLIRFAVSRQREYLADATAAEVLRDPQSMVNALRRIDDDTDRDPPVRGRDRPPVVRGTERDPRAGPHGEARPPVRHPPVDEGAHRAARDPQRRDRADRRTPAAGGPARRRRAAGGTGLAATHRTAALRPAIGLALARRPPAPTRRPVRPN